MKRSAWLLLAAATALMALGMGVRSAFGLFVSPLNTATGIGLAGLGFAMALGQLAQGAAQPVVGWLADRFGTPRTIVFGAAALAVATLSLLATKTVFTMSVAMVAMAAAGSAAAGNTLLLAEVGRRVPIERRAVAFGVVSAGGSAGQLLLAPTTQAAMTSFGWVAVLVATAAVGLLAIPLAFAFRTDNVAGDHVQARSDSIADVLSGTPFWLTALTFGVCGFHVSYLTAHMPGFIERCGLDPQLAGPWLALLGAANLAGSLAVGFWLRRYSTHAVLISILAMRAVSVLLLLVVPLTPTVLFGFGALMGISYMSLLPAISQQVAQRYGPDRMATILGFIALVHQCGSFAGVWLGGIFAEAGADSAVWSIDIGLALVAIALQWRLARGRTGRQAFWRVAQA